MPFVATAELPVAAANAVADAIGEDGALMERGLDLLEVTADSWLVTVYFVDAPSRVEEDALALALHKAGVPGKFAVEALPDRDWVALSLAGLAPVEAGRFVVHGAHDRHRVPANRIDIEIEAAAAFGTGHHGTTTGCLLAIDALAKSRPIRSALDIGTGSGVLAIGIAKLAKARVVASEIDPVAAAIADENMRSNGVAKLVQVVVADGMRDAAIQARAPYDLIVANILAGPLVTLAPAISNALTDDGAVVLSGLLTPQARAVAATYRTLGLMRSRAITLGEWTTLVLSRGRRRGRPTRRSQGQRYRSDVRSEIPDEVPGLRRTTPGSGRWPARGQAPLLRRARNDNGVRRYEYALGLLGKHALPGALQRTAIGKAGRDTRFVQAEDTRARAAAQMRIAGSEARDCASDMIAGRRGTAAGAGQDCRCHWSSPSFSPAS